MSSKISDIKNWLKDGSINIFGAPLSGKDTQSKRLAEALGASLIGGGAILRGDNMPDYIKEAMKTGELIATDDYLSIVMPYLSRGEFKGKPMILNSIGRWHSEEDGVIYATNQSGHPIKAVLYLKLDEKESVERLQKSKALNDRGERQDDTQAKLDIRLKEFRDKTLPVVESYRNLGLVIDIDGTKSRDLVYDEIIDKLHEFASRA